MIPPQDSDQPEVINVLYVEDDPPQQMFLKLFFEEVDPSIHVETIESATAALEMIDHSFDCILLDYQMPHSSGINLARSIREKSNVPIIMYTGQGSETVASEAFEAGVNDYVRKQVDPGHYVMLARRVRIAVEKSRSDDRIKELMETYERLVDNADEAVFRVKSEGGHVLYLNLAAERILGYSREEWMEDPGLGAKIIHPDYVERQEQIIREINEKRKPLRDVVLGWVTKDGREVLLEYTIIPVLDEEGEVLYFESIGRDITAQRQMTEALKSSEARALQMVEERTLELRASEEKYWTLIEMSRDAVIVNDAEKFLFANSYAAKLLGFDSPSQLVGKKVAPFLAPENRERQAANIKARLVEGKAPRRQEFPMIRIDGTTVHVEGIFNTIEYEGNPAILGTLRDITERRRLEEMQDNFMTMATHELKTPLASITGYTELIRKGITGEVPKKIDDALAVVERNANRLHELINDILDIRNLESGRLSTTLVSYSFQDSIAELEEDGNPMFHLKNQSFEIQIPPDLPQVYADKRRIKQVIHHLLINASKFTPEGGAITLTVRDAGEKVEVSVSDTGIGLTGEGLEKVFERFPDLKRAQGLGLGLSICKGLIELHGGEIWAESEGEGMGATFRFTLQKYGAHEK